MSDIPDPLPAVFAALPLVPFASGVIPEPFAKSADPTSPPPMRMMAARAMAPLPPKMLVLVVYQLMMDPEPRIAGAALKSFWALDDKVLSPFLADAATAPAQVLEALCHTLVDKFALAERVLLSRQTPDTGFVHMAQYAVDERLINVVVENQERLLRSHDIVRGLKKNPKCMRSDLDKAIDFLVREGVFLDDMSEFDDSFVRLGKAEMLEALKKVKIREALIDDEDRAQAAAQGMPVDEYILAGGMLTAEDLADDMDGAVVEGPANTRGKKKWAEMSKGERMKAAASGGLEFALEAIKSPNRALAVAGINNPKINDSAIPQIIRNKQLADDVIRVICNNGEWTKSYEVKFSLVQNPKTPLPLVLRWLTLMRANDLKTIAKSKGVPSQVALQAKRLLDRAS